MMAECSVRWLNLKRFIATLTVTGNEKTLSDPVVLLSLFSPYIYSCLSPVLSVFVGGTEALRGAFRCRCQNYLKLHHLLWHRTLSGTPWWIPVHLIKMQMTIVGHESLTKAWRQCWKWGLYALHMPCIAPQGQLKYFESNGINNSES